MKSSVTPAEPRTREASRQHWRSAVKSSSHQKWLIGVGIGVAVLLVLSGLWAGGVFMGKTTGENLIEGLPKETPAPLPNSSTNSIGMKLVLVQPGTFLMGSLLDEDRSPDENQHEVEITRSFYVGIYEVTQEQYQRVMGQNPRWFLSTGGGKDKVKGIDMRQFPVEQVSWEDAVEFCHRLSELHEEKENERLYRLPTEAEWEYICRGGPLFKKPSPAFYFGNSLSSSARTEKRQAPCLARRLLERQWQGLSRWLPLPQRARRSQLRLRLPSRVACRREDIVPAYLLFPLFCFTVASRGGARDEMSLPS